MAVRPFVPIAIVGQGCILPDCADPAALWETVAAGRVAIASAPEGDWRIDPARVLTSENGRATPDRAWTDLGGYVRGFADLFDPTAVGLDPELVSALDPVCQWSLYAARQAMAGVAGGPRSGVVLGNLSYPTRLHSRLAEQVWLEALLGVRVPDRVHAWNRFMSGLPAMLVARSLGFEGGSLALDAACASGLYAVKLACDRLQAGQADLMLAGAVNAADQLFLHVGFCQLNAMSRSGRSRPFHGDADGLIPAEGAAFVALRRLDDALAAGEPVLGVIRGIGLSNDGRSGGFLSPARDGQIRSMRAALAGSGIAPANVDFVECHATGTPVGDAVELGSLAAVYDHRPLALGSLKANLGHLITASGLAGLIKTLAAMRHGVLPGTPDSRPLTAAVAEHGFDVPDALQPWPDRDGQRTAAVSSFGFGGNNAHLLVTQHPDAGRGFLPPPDPMPQPELAVVGVALRTHRDADAAAFLQRLLGGHPGGDHDLEHITLEPARLAFPPLELRKALGQQLLLLELAGRLDPGGLDPARTGIYVGMQTDSQGCRYGLRLRWPELLAAAGIDAEPGWLEAAADAITGPTDAGSVIGKMPNICANRLSNQFDLQGPGFTVSREELSGDAALSVAGMALVRGEIDAALVAAVDFCREPVHEHAVDGVDAADAGVMLVVKLRERAEADGDRVLAVITEGAEGNEPELPEAALPEAAHAAEGLMRIALGTLLVGAGVRLDDSGLPQPLLPGPGGVGLRVTNRSFGGESQVWSVRRATADGIRMPWRPAPEVRRYAAADPETLAARVVADRPGGDGPCRLALVGAAPEIDDLRLRAAERLRCDPAPYWIDGGISHCRAPLGGDLAYVFTGAAAAHAGMGRELLLAMPGLVERLSGRLGNPAAAADWVYRDADLRGREPFAQLAGASFLSQVHAELSGGVLGLSPDASLGMSSGETNALFAFGVWQDMDGLFADIDASGLYSEALAGDFAAIRNHWGLPPGTPVHWSNHRVAVDPERVRSVLADTGHAYLTLINGPRDCVIGGDAAACRQILEALGNPPAVPLGHDLAVHCPAVAPFADTWRRLHDRPTYALDRPRFYGNHFGGPFRPSRETVADALTGQALTTVDFPLLVERAWQDGVRVFLEHGPRDSLTQAIGETLGDRPHLAVSLDRPGVPGDVQAWRAAAALWCAGLEPDLEALRAFQGPPPVPATQPGEGVAFRIVAPPVTLPPRDDAKVPRPAKAETVWPGPRLLPLPPPLASAWPLPGPPPAPSTPECRASAPATAAAVTAAQAPADPRLALLLDAHRKLTTAHNDYLEAQAAGLAAWRASLARITAMAFGDRGVATQAETVSRPARAQALAPVSSRPVPESAAAVEAIPSDPVPERANSEALPGPAFDRAQLEILAGGRISEVFGPAFADQDAYPVQVRMPEPPLLLCDRVLGIDGAPHSMGRGTIWTETDVHADSWYLHHGRMPAGIFIESGQADLLLISWLGIDSHNRGERAYRLLGCELTFHGELPKPGDTLEYRIEVDGHARQGDVRLFFFHYDCHIGGALRIAVRNGQAGFFSREELAGADGVLWSPERAEYTPQPRLDAPPRPSARRSFTTEQVQAFTHGDLEACFGPEFFLTHSHTRTPCTAAGDRNFMERVTAFDPEGGPAGRGYLRVDTSVHPDDWFFAGHFKNDPCMPGTLMAEACLQAMAFYMAGLGVTVERDGWRFQPVREVRYRFVCRGQVTPASKRLVYEIFVDEFIDGDTPVLFAHVLCSVDGRKAFLCERLGLELVPDWPLTSMPEVLRHPVTDADAPPARIGDFPLDFRALIHCAWGQPSLAFGPGFANRDGPVRTPRLPGPPYHFMTRILELDAQMGRMEAGARVVAAYDPQPEDWYFRDNPAGTMPNCVLMEVALQPCGWLASLTLDPKVRQRDLVFRNLDGEALQHREIQPGDGRIVTVVELLSVSRMGELVIEKFAVSCQVGDEEVFTAETVFGFFPPQAMAEQKGFAPEPAERLLVEAAPTGSAVELTDESSRARLSGRHRARLPGGRLRMLDRISGWWPSGGAAGLGAIRAEKDVDPRDWFFRAHFFQDPVQPGSLGVEAMLQAIQALMLCAGMDRDEAQPLARPRFETIRITEPMVWHYRGQVTPGRERVVVTFEVAERGRDERGPFVAGTATLSVDGLLIYRAPRIGMRLVDAADATDDRHRQPLAAELALAPQQIVADAGGTCANLPFNPLQGGAPGALDAELLRARWAASTGITSGPAPELALALTQRFVRRVVVEDPAAIERLQGRPLLYLANHQTAVESFLFLGVALALGGIPVAAIAKREHRETWLGRIRRLAEAQLGGANPLRMLIFDRSRQGDLLTLLGEHGAGLAGDPCSLLVHVDGTRALAAGTSVRRVGSVLLDMALRYDLPIVPVRFSGGLPVAPAPGRQEFPCALGRQDYRLGAPLDPAILRTLPYAERALRVTAAIDELGAGQPDRPLPGALEFTAAAARQQALGRDPVQAVLRAAVESAPEHAGTLAQWLEAGGEAAWNMELTNLLHGLVGTPGRASSIDRGRPG